MEPLRAWRLVVADFQHFNEEQCPDPHQTEKSDPDPQQGQKSDPLHWYRNRGRLWCPPNLRSGNLFKRTVSISNHNSGRLNSRKSGKLACRYRTSQAVFRIYVRITVIPFYCTERRIQGWIPSFSRSKQIYIWKKIGKGRFSLCGKEPTKKFTRQDESGKLFKIPISLNPNSNPGQI